MAYLHEHIILPLSDLLRGESVHTHLDNLHNAEQWSQEQMHDFQQVKLRQLLTHAAENVPFYRDWFDDHNLNPHGVALEQMPIISKAIMRQEGIDRFTSANIPANQRIPSRSSGSTGEPFSFYVSREASSANTAAKLRTWYQAGYRLGDRYMKIANGARHGKLKKLQDRVNNCIYVPFYSIDDETLRTILDTIERRHPLYIRSYPAPLHLLSRYRQSHPEYTYRPHHIFTTGSTLPAEYRKEIETAFGCDVIDSYSCEGTPNTYETTSHNGYHICDYYGIIEVLDDDGRPVTDGIGRVVSTDLWNLAHPFIRYDTQDLVEVHNGQIQRIMGRECDSFINSNGVLYTVHNFSHYFLYEIVGVDRYQIVHRRDKSLVINIVVNSDYSEPSAGIIIDHWQPLLGVPVSVSIVDDIPLMKNNKYRTIIDELTE